MASVSGISCFHLNLIHSLNLFSPQSKKNKRKRNKKLKEMEMHHPFTLNLFSIRSILMLSTSVLLTAACVKTGKPELAKRAIELAECRFEKDGWPKYYDGKNSYYVCKQSQKMQTWSIAGYLVAKMLIDDPSCLDILAIGDDRKMKHTFTRSTTLPNRDRVLIYNH